MEDERFRLVRSVSIRSINEYNGMFSAHAISRSPIQNWPS